MHYSYYVTIYLCVYVYGVMVGRWLVTVCTYVQVAAHVKTDDGEEQWILAVVNSYNSHSHKYGTYILYV